VRLTLVVLSLAATVLVVTAAWPGLLWTLSRHRLVVGVVLATFLASALVVSMSRYRVPVEPLMLVLAAGFLAQPRCPPWRSIRGALLVGGWPLLVSLWALNLTEIGAELSRIL
jgi:Na+/melibiose symporter-like transporter